MVTVGSNGITANFTFDSAGSGLFDNNAATQGMGVGTTFTGFFTQTNGGGAIGDANAGIAGTGGFSFSLERNLEEERRRRRAEGRARRLFRQVVGDRAYKRFRQSGWHEVLGASGTRYRLAPGRKVQVMKGPSGDAVDHELCGVVPGGVPWYDTLTVQHLMLSSSRQTEEQFTKTANRFGAAA
jgi:hypothetical protein